MKHSSRKVLENHERFTTVSLYMPSTYMIVTPLHHPPAPTNKSSSSSSNHLMNNNKSSSTPTPNFDSSMALTILVLVTAIFFMGFFSVYLRCFARVSSTQEQQVSLRLRRNRRRNNQTSSSSGVQESSSHHHQQHHIHHGLDPSTVGSLPLVLAAHVVTRNKAKETVVDCAVCLSEFQDTEMVKMIPFCEHVFHPQCIDMWFLSHSSCPLCRSTKLFPPPPPVNNSSNSSVIVNNKVNAAAAPLSLISTTTELEDREVLIDDDDDRKSLDLESTVVVDQDEVIVMMVGADNKLRLMTMRRTCSCSSLLSGMRSSVHDQVLLHDESLQRSSSSRWF